MPRIEPGLEFGRIPPGVASEDAIVSPRHLVAMLLDVTDRGLDLGRTEAEQARDPVAMPALLVIVEDVIDGDPRAGDLGSSAAVDDLRSDHGGGPRPQR